MACTNCSTSTNGTPKGCKNNGTCGTNGCNKLTVFNWLANMELPEKQAPFNYVEVRFKNGRKDFFYNADGLSLSIGDVVATEASSGHDIGLVGLTGELVRVQMKKKKQLAEKITQKIYRKANQKDIDVWQAAQAKEEPTKVKARQIALRLKLKMKISDVEYQGDGTKAIFYYTADDRVDFRQLIKEYASSFGLRIEMKQVGLRQEAARLGGIGSCGRELCCSTWLTDFRSVNTSAARYQQLSLNPQKLAGQCGKLKCCLNYELDSYLDALDEFPNTEIKIITAKGVGVCQKIDIFKKTLWYAYEGDWANWHKISTEEANNAIEKNKQKQTIPSLESLAKEEDEAKTSTTFYKEASTQESLTRFDKPQKNNNNKRRRNNKRRKTKNNE